MAERLARHLRERFPDAATLVHHREEPHWPPRRAALPDGTAVERTSAPEKGGGRTERMRARSTTSR
jgi:hypothetical protein